MAIVAIRAALETALAAMTPIVTVAYENAVFTPVPGVPFCKAYLLTGTPQNPTFGGGFYREVGMFQVTLFYPIQNGTAAAALRAEMIQQKFFRGSSFSNAGVTVRIIGTPAITAAQIDGDRWTMPIRCQWTADIFS